MSAPIAGGKVAAASVIVGEEYQRVRTFHQDQSDSVWSKHVVASANSVASGVQAAAGPSTRNVCTWLTVKLVGGASAPAAVNTSVSLIDGDTGGTTYLWRSTISLPATAGADNGIALSGLWLPGTANTKMTLEFLAAGGANSIESISFGGTTIKE